MNRVIFVSQGGKTTGTTYDANGNQLTATDWLGNTVTNVYDALSRLVEKRDAFDLPQETYFYDESSRQIAAEDVYGRRTIYEYDRNNRLVLTTAPDGYTVAQTYDRRGNVVTQTDVLGNTTYYAYDFLGRLVSVTDALDQATTYTYDLKGNLLSQTDAAGNTTYLEYNCRDLLVRKISPGGRTGEPGAYIYDPTAVISYTYDALGNTATRTDRNGNTTDYEWDVHGNLVRQAIGTAEISYTYDSNGNVLTTTDSLGTTTRVYDEFNRCVEKTVPIIGTSVYAYDITSGLPAGHVAETTTDPKGNTTLREYDRTGRLIRVTDTSVDSTTHTVIYTYNDNGSVASVLYPDGAREDYTYTAGNLLETLTNTLSDGTVLETYVYTYDLARNLLIKQDAKGTTTYTYDSLGRVLTVTEPSGKLTEYTYDGSGNRSTQTVTETDEDETVTVVRTTYTYDARNRLIQLQKHDISDAALDPILLEITDYTYDHSGNQLTTTRTTYTDGVAGTPVMLQSNTYDVWNQLVRTETENGTIVENTYNGDGRRVIKSVNGAATYYLYEYDMVILETNVFGDVTGRNVYGLNLLIRTVGVDTFYYMYNGHADVTALLTPDGTVAASYYYDAFGNILEQTGDVNNSVLFAGYQFDKETGLYYLNARMYDPVTARFMQEDTYAGQQSDPLSLNLYTYCHNSPLLYFDPTGHWEESITVNGKTFDTSWLLVVDGRPVIRNAADAAFINHLNAELSRARKDLNLSIAKLPKEKQTEFNNRLESSPDIFKDIDSIAKEVASQLATSNAVQTVKDDDKNDKTGYVYEKPNVTVEEVLLEIFEGTPDLTEYEIAFILEAVTWLGTPYAWAGPVKNKYCDCGGLARGIFELLSKAYKSVIFPISTSGADGWQRGWDKKNNEYTYGRTSNTMWSAMAKKSSQLAIDEKNPGIVIWDNPFRSVSYSNDLSGKVTCDNDRTKKPKMNEGRLDNTESDLESILRPGDVIYYDFSGDYTRDYTNNSGSKDPNPDGYVDHVGIYLGNGWTIQTFHEDYGVVLMQIDKNDGGRYSLDSIVGVKRYLPN